MQQSDGTMKEINPELFQELLQDNKQLKAEGEKENPVFQEGETLEIRGGRFKIESIGKTRLTLIGQPHFNEK